MGGCSWFLLIYQSFFESKFLKKQCVSLNAVGGLMTESTYNNDLINLNPEFYQKVTKRG